jgi:very-short-patch-repair endonuclease
MRGPICDRPFTEQRDLVDVEDLPIVKPSSNVPLVERDGYWLTPIEAPFYDALRETGAVFAVQPWVQGLDGRYRPDFMIFFDGGAYVIELDGHDSHKSREQRTKDAKRERWFEARGMRVLRWTGSEVHANAQDCVRHLLEIVRRTPSRY